MEDSKTGILTAANGGSDIETRFALLCKDQFAFDERRYSDALKLFRESKNVLLTNTSPIGSNTPEELERYLFAFVLYTVKRLGEMSPSGATEATNQSGLTLCQILRSVKLNFVDFFKELPQFVVRVGPTITTMYGAEWEKRLEVKELQTNFVHLRCLSNHYNRAFQEFFKTNESDTKLAVTSTSVSSQVSDYSRFGWLLFLALRVHALSSSRDLVTCIHGLVSILAILILHIPARLRNFSILDSPLFEKKTGKGVNLIASLCLKYETSDDEVKRMMEKAYDLISNILKKKPKEASECETENLVNIDRDGLKYVDDLLLDSSLPTIIGLLEKDYDAADWNQGDIDERLFLNGEDSLLGSGSLSGGAMCLSGTKRKFDAMASPTKTITSPLSPSRSPAPYANGASVDTCFKASTPVSTAMNTLKWLRTVIFPLPSHPSALLEKYFTSCDRDVSSEIVRRAHIILEAIFPNNVLGERCTTGDLPSSTLVDSIWAQQRQQESLKLYYRVLEAMCIAEAQILNANNLTSLLTNERFHRCMLACSAELVLATHKTVTMLFPAVVEKTGITAFDLSKVIESFIRHEDSLPRELRRHLNSLEERLLESMVWEKGSSMYNSLTIARPTLSAEISRLGLMAEPMPSLDAIAVHSNMSCGGLPPLPSFQRHDIVAGQNGDIRSPKRASMEYRSMLVERNSFTSPIKDRLISNLKQKLTPPALQSAFASPTRPNPGGGGETCAETGINIFFCKIVKLAAVRINNMVEKLREKLKTLEKPGGPDLAQLFRESVYSLFQKILNQRTSLFFCRHIDQIILCSFYGVARISRVPLSFNKDIIFYYRKQPQCKLPVFRSVYVDWSSARPNGKQGQDHVDIITFYNEIFIPSVKPLLVELSALGTGMKPERDPDISKNREDQGPASPKMSAFPSLPDMSPKKISTVHNIYVSPLRSSKMDALISHSSKSYYACVGESTHAYQSPSKDLTAINDRLNSTPRTTRRSLNLDADVDLVSDTLVANSLYLRNGSCDASPSQTVKTEPLDL
ncbi:retinoblastoma-related protein-like isoform X1 [Silene latifolia]|uniref:retinoblastoma-related protein-like isoform X1 n=1 Tax=Silene latifolia TaxID=37657 RepID=UPI003D7715FB